MAVSKEDILETLSNMTVMEVVDLIAAMEEKFGVSAAAFKHRPSWAETTTTVDVQIDVKRPFCDWQSWCVRDPHINPMV